MVLWSLITIEFQYLSEKIFQKYKNMGSRDRGRFKDCNNKLQRLAGALIQFNIQVDHMITFRNSVVRLFHFIEMLQLIVIIHQSTRGAQDSLGYLTYELFTSATTPFDELGIS